MTAGVMLQENKSAARKRAKRKFKFAEFACVYAIGQEKGRPLKLGWASDISRRVQDLQTSNWQRLGVHTVAWTQGAPLSRRLESKCHELLDASNRRLTGEWFDITPEWAEKVIACAANSIGVPVFFHNEMLGRLAVYREFVDLSGMFWQARRAA